MVKWKTITFTGLSIAVIIALFFYINAETEEVKMAALTYGAMILAVAVLLILAVQFKIIKR